MCRGCLRTALEQKEQLNRQGAKIAKFSRKIPEYRVHLSGENLAATILVFFLGVLCVLAVPTPDSG
jgi:hypothetical protein